MAKFTITIDSNDYPGKEWQEYGNCLLQAQNMRIAINSYYSDVIRYYLKYRELPGEQYNLIEEVANKLDEHFQDFKEQ